MSTIGDDKIGKVGGEKKNRVEKPRYTFKVLAKTLLLGEIYQRKNKIITAFRVQTYTYMLARCYSGNPCEKQKLGNASLKLN